MHMRLLCCSPSTSCPNLAPLLLRLLSLGANVRPLWFENELNFQEAQDSRVRIGNDSFPGGVTRRLSLPLAYQRVVWEASFDFSATAQYVPWTYSPYPWWPPALPLQFVAPPPS